MTNHFKFFLLLAPFSLGAAGTSDKLGDLSFDTLFEPQESTTSSRGLSHRSDEESKPAGYRLTAPHEPEKTHLEVSPSPKIPIPSLSSRHSRASSDETIGSDGILITTLYPYIYDESSISAAINKPTAWTVVIYFKNGREAASQSFTARRIMLSKTETLVDFQKRTLAMLLLMADNVFLRYCNAAIEGGSVIIKNLEKLELDLNAYDGRYPKASWQQVFESYAQKGCTLKVYLNE